MHHFNFFGIVKKWLLQFPLFSQGGFSLWLTKEVTSSGVKPKLILWSNTRGFFAIKPPWRINLKYKDTSWKSYHSARYQFRCRNSIYGAIMLNPIEKSKRSILNRSLHHCFVNLYQSMEELSTAHPKRVFIWYFLCEDVYLFCGNTTKVGSIFAEIPFLPQKIDNLLWSYMAFLAQKVT